MKTLLIIAVMYREIGTHDLCDKGAVLYQLRYQGNWVLDALLVRNMPVDGLIAQRTAPVMGHQKSWVRIPSRPDFFFQALISKHHQLIKLCT